MEVGLTIKDQYQVVEHIGRGGMADVWSARDQRLNRLVAIKTIAQSLSTDADPIALFEQEAQTIARMEHPHILPIYDFGEYRNNLYIVMRYVTGGSLEDKLEDEPLTLQETLQIAGNIAKALDYAHANDVIHLDLKPPNILMDSSGSPYLADFGLATVLDKQGRAQNPGSGTLLYMAPEQLVAEVIDHRADIYSFSVMIFHMLTGTLPYEGTAPLAIKQLQYQQELINIDELRDDVPPQISDILRQGTAVEPGARQGSLTEIIEQMRDVLQAETIDLDAAWESTGELDFDYGLETAILVDVGDAGLLEAADIYSRARHVWAGGNGRFLLGVSHFMMMCDYYVEAESHGMEIDELGQQMLLRGALEYDYQVDYWWSQVNDEVRRWVCLHTIRSESPPARIRAMHYLETLPDDPQKSVIPGLVANALSIETSKDAKIAALRVLGTRAKLIKPSQSFDIKTEFRGRLLTTSTRLGIELLPQKVWKDAVYSPEIDLFIAHEALDDEDHEVAELAARIIGQIHSLTALRFIANEQRRNTPHALRALALIRDEAPYLPDVVSQQARVYAWIANTIRRITDQPMQIVLSFLFALLGGAIAFGQQVYITFRSQALFTPQRWGNTLAVGLLMGLFIAILVMVSHIIIVRLRGFWPNWLRLSFSLLTGLLVGMLTWSGFTWLYLNQPPLWDLMRMGGMGLAFGLILSSLIHLKSWQSFIVTTIAVFLPIFASYYNWCTLIFFCNTDATGAQQLENIISFSIAPIALAGFGFGSLIGLFVSRPPQDSTDTPPSPFSLTKYGGLLTSLVVGIIGTVGIYLLLLNQAMVNWDHVTFLFVMPTLISFVAIVLLDNIQRLLYMIIGVVAFAAITFYVHDVLLTLQTAIVPQAAETNYIDTLFGYNYYWEAFTVALPFAALIAFGAFGLDIFRDIRQVIGEPHEPKERNTWLTGLLVYAMAVSLLVTVLAPFSMHENVVWALAWTLIGGATFISAYATWQWKRWGVYGLVICGVLFVIGGIVADIRYLSDFFSALGGVSVSEETAEVMRVSTIQSVAVWLAWAGATVFLTIGAIRRRLWSAFGFIIMIVLWFVIAFFFTDLGDSVTALVVVHVPLIMYAIRFDWDLFESGQRKVKPAVEADVPSASPAPTSEPISDGAVAPVAVGTLATELDPNPAVQTVADLQTEYDLHDAQVDARHMSTEVDASPTIPDDAQNLATEADPNPSNLIGELLTEKDVNEERVDASELMTEIDPNAEMDASDLMTEIDPNAEMDASDLMTEIDPNAEIDAGDRVTELDAQSALDLDQLPPQKDKPANSDDQKAPSKPRLSIDTSLLKNPKTDAKPDSKSSRRGLKIDPSLLGAKPDSDDKPDSKSSRQGLKIDPSLLNDKQDKDDTVAEDDEDNRIQDKDPTLPSRPTEKLSTSEIKKEIAEEARRIKEEADKNKADSGSKPKFKLNTSLIKPKDKDESSSDEE